MGVLQPTIILDHNRKGTFHLGNAKNLTFVIVTSCNMIIGFVRYPAELFHISFHVS